MAHFDDVILPDRWAIGATQSGPITGNQAVFTGSGRRKVNERWSKKLHRWNVGYAVQRSTDAYEILKYYNSVGGNSDTFLAKNPNDWNTTDGLMKPGDETNITKDDQPAQNTVTNGFLGDGATLTFQTGKRYTIGSTANRFQPTVKLKVNTIKVAIGGSTISTAAWSVSTTSGIITLTTAATTAQAVTWGGEFYSVVFFENGSLEESIENYDARSIPSIVLQETFITT
jgi:uncharacterized protein (TIGR02217 family)